MSNEQLQENIILHDGFILSDGTLNPQHLLSKAYDLIVKYELENDELKQAILECFETDGDYYATIQDAVSDDNSLFMCQYHGRVQLKNNAESMDIAYDVWHERVYNFFNDIAHDGFYFGSNEGDGACIGWFTLWNENENEEEY